MQVDVPRGGEGVRVAAGVVAGKWWRRLRI